MWSAAARTSEEDLQMLREKHKNLQKRVEVTTALIHEREREISSLEAQLEDVKMMGEMKNLKKARPAKQLVGAGALILNNHAATSLPKGFMDSHYAFGACHAVATGSAEDVVSDLKQTGPSLVPRPLVQQRNQPSHKSDGPKVPFPDVVHDLLSNKNHSNGMEIPGIVLASALIGGAGVANAAWGSLKTRLPPSVGTSIEVAALAGSVMALGSLFASV